MAQRTVCLNDGKYIGIETIYTIAKGQQINIPEKLKELRKKSRSNELFCPCGCGANLVLVAGDKNLREQHFRLKDSAFNIECTIVEEGKRSVDSKIVLKCWLDDKLMVSDLEMRVPIQAVDDIDRKYEFSFLSREKKIALSYIRKRINLSDDKLDILEANGQGIHIIYMVDINNGGCDGQYPEGLMKVQAKQEYCLLLDVEEADYRKAALEAVFYTKDIDGLWQEVVFAKGLLKDFYIDYDGNVMFKNENLKRIQSRRFNSFKQSQIDESKRRVEKFKRELENEEKRKQEILKRQEEQKKKLILQKENAEKLKKISIEKRRVEEKQQQRELKKRIDEFKKNMESNFSQQETQVIDSEGIRWIKCEFCGNIARVSEFSSYGGAGRINLGICRDCDANNPAVKQKTKQILAELNNMPAKENKLYDETTCPECGGTMRERDGQYGKFMGCKNYPRCRYTRRM